MWPLPMSLMMMPNREIQEQLKNVIQWRWKRNRIAMGTNGLKAMHRKSRKTPELREEDKTHPERKKETKKRRTSEVKRRKKVEGQADQR